MYPINAASPQRVAIGSVVQISNGAVQTSGVSIKVLPFGTTASAGGGTTGYEEGIVHYTPTQAETNYTSFVLIAYKTGCIPATVTVVTTASAVAGYAGLDWGVMTQKTATNALTNTSIASVSGAVGSVTGAVGSVTGAVGSVTGAVGSVTGNVGGNVTGSVGSVVGAVGSVTAMVTANTIQISGDSVAADNAEAFFDGTGYAGTNNVIPTVTTLTGHTPQTGDTFALANGANGFVAIKAKTDNLPAAPAAVGDIPTAVQNADALLNRDMSAVSDTNARTPLNAFRVLRNKVSLAGTALTVTKEDDTTAAWTAVATAAPGADPISAIDPA